MKHVKAKLTEKRTQETIERTIEMPYVEGYVDVKLPLKGHFGRAFVTVFKEALIAITTEANLSKNEYKLLLYLIATTSIDNMVVTNTTTLSEVLSMDRSNVHRSLKGLEERNIIIKKGEYRNYRRASDLTIELNYDQLNYNLAYTGAVKQYRKRRLEHPELTNADGSPLIVKAKEIKQIMSDKCAKLVLSDSEVVDIETGEIIEVD